MGWTAGKESRPSAAQRPKAAARLYIVYIERAREGKLLPQGLDGKLPAFSRWWPRLARVRRPGTIPRALHDRRTNPHSFAFLRRLQEMPRQKYAARKYPARKCPARK